MAKKPIKKATKAKTELRDDSQDLKGGPGKYSHKLAAFWKKQIEDVEQLEGPWHKKSDEIVRRFRDDRRKLDGDMLRRLNVLWANYKVLKPALYSNMPKPIIERRYLQRDPVARTSSIILERTSKYQLEINGFNTSVNRAVSDYLLPGRGVVWVRYEPEIEDGGSLPVMSQTGVEDELEKIAKETGEGEESSEEETDTEKLETTGEQLLSEQAPVDYIYFKDFKMFPKSARTWDEVVAIGKRVPVSRKEAKERFGEDVAKSLKPDTASEDVRSGRGNEMGSAVFHDTNERNITVYEIWNKSDARVYWVNKGYEYLVDVKNDFLKLKKFFPVPEPISSTLTNDSLIPVPDYLEYQDQAVQIDELTQRIALLTKACKIVGTYDASQGAVKRLLKEGFENDLLPVDNWAAFADKGGVKGSISFMPIDEIQKVIQTLQLVRQQSMQDLDLIAGITDIQRGTTDSRETLGGLRLKNNNTGSRLTERQNEVARFCRDTVAIVAEIAAKHFSDKTLVQCSGILFDDDMQPEAMIEEHQLKQQTQQQQLAPPQMPGAPPQAPGMGAPPMAMPKPPMPMQPPIPGPPGAAMGMPPPSPMPMMPLPGGPPSGPPGMPPMVSPAPPQNNVVPFPGGPPQQNPMQALMGALNGGMGQPPQIDPEMLIMERIQKSIDLLRKDVPLGYRIEVETDSTIFGDAAQERQDAVEFITGATQFLTQAGGVAEKLPEAIPMFGRMLQWGVRKFRVGRDVESAINVFVDKMDKKAKEMAKNPQQNPEQIKAQAEQQRMQAEAQMQQATHQQELERMKAEGAAKAQELMMNQQAEQQKQAMEAQKAQMEDARAERIAQMEMSQKEREMALDAHAKEREHQMTMQKMDKEAQLNEATHKTKMEQMKLQAQEKDKARKEKAKKPKKAA